MTEGISYIGKTCKVTSYGRVYIGICLQQPKTQQYTLLFGYDKNYPKQKACISPLINTFPNDIEILEDDLVLKKEYDVDRKANLWRHLGYPYTIGSDPEIFVTDKAGKLLPAFEFLPSPKDKEKVHSPLYKQTIFWDGFQAEFNTRVGTCLAYHTDAVQDALNGLLLKANTYKKGAKLSIDSTIEVPMDLITEGKDEHVQFGCMPSLNVYGMKGLDADGRSIPLRSAGGHIHFGCGKMSEAQASNTVKMLDAILGVACVSLFAGYDDPRRRTLYGLAGEYRLPAHGLEYRTLSNMWLSHPIIKHIVFDLARKVFMIGHRNITDLWKFDEQKVIQIINTCDVSGARTLLKENEDSFRIILDTVYRGHHSPNAALTYVQHAYMNGIDSIIKDPTDVAGNWHLNKTWNTHCGNNNCCMANATNLNKIGSLLGSKV